MGSDIHGNRTASGAAVASPRETAPDLVPHGGDPADGGLAPGNRTKSRRGGTRIGKFARLPAAPAALWNAVREMAAATRAMLAGKRISWLRGLPRTLVDEEIARVHAAPGGLRRCPTPEAAGAEMEAVCGALDRPLAVHGHIHRPVVRLLAGKRAVASAGPVGLPYDSGPARATCRLTAGGRQSGGSSTAAACPTRSGSRECFAPGRRGLREAPAHAAPPRVPVPPTPFKALLRRLRR